MMEREVERRARLATADDLDESKGLHEQQEQRLERAVGMDEEKDAAPETDGRDEVDEDAVEPDGKARVQYRPVSSERSRRYAFEPESGSAGQQDEKKDSQKRLARAAATRDQALDQTRQTRFQEDLRQRLLGTSAEAPDAQDVEMTDQQGICYCIMRPSCTSKFIRAFKIGRD